MKTFLRHVMLCKLLCILSFGMLACSDNAASFSLLGGGDKKAKVAKAEEEPVRNDPESRAVQVAWTSARAVKCGFYFDQNKLRQTFLSKEEQQGLLGDQLKKVRLTYDFTFKSITIRIKDNPAYCNKNSVQAIRKDLNRHLAGDYTPSPKKKKAQG